MSSIPRLSTRYEIKEIIGEGGMGIVYSAIDLEMRSEVALKTIRELLDPQQLELFRRECAVLRQLRHPNIVDLYDFGVSEENGSPKPFFVMPYLPGATLDKLIKNPTVRLTPDRVVDIVTQTARGLQAAHDQGLIHRDVKPSNIFVLSDDSVKIIDFGVVHLTDQNSRVGFKGTMAYMSPEQWEMLAPTAVSDVFSLAVVCYEALTRRRPFNGNNEHELREAILQSIPPPVFELNPAVSVALSQVVHAAMAKQPWNRTSTARQFADELQKALHGQAIERFDPSRVEPRIARAQKALETSEYDFAAEILAEIESEGHVDPVIRSLRRQIDQAIRMKKVKQALESAQHRFSESEYQLALQKVDEVLRLDPGNAVALKLKDEINSSQKTHQIENWFRHAQDHLKNYAFNHARQALQSVLRIKPTDTAALQMLAELDRRENEYARERREKEELYKIALEAWKRGEVSVAFNKLERVLELDRRAPDNASSESALSYQNLYEQVRSEHDRVNSAYQESRKLLSENDYSTAAMICEQILAKYPENTLFQALKEDVGERQRQYVSSSIIKLDRDMEAEPDLDRKVAILSEAVRLYPTEPHFEERLNNAIRRRDLVAGIKQKTDNLEERGQYAEALAQLEILRAIYPQYPGMDFEIDRLSKRRDQQARVDSKGRWVNQIDAALAGGDFSHALSLLNSALADFPEDAELMTQERLAREGMDRALEASSALENALSLCAQGDLNGGLDKLWQALKLDERNPLIQAVLVETLLKRASAVLETDLQLSEQLIEQAIKLDPANRQAVNMQRLVVDRRKETAVDELLSRSRESQASGNLRSAVDVVKKGLASYPDERRLMTRMEALTKLAGPPESSPASETVVAGLEETVVESPQGKRAMAAATTQTLMPETIAVPAAPLVPPAPSTAAPNNEPVSRSPEGPKPASSKRWVLIAVAAIVPLLVLLAFVVSQMKSTAGPASSTTIEAAVTIDASMPGAHVLVDGVDAGVAPVKVTLPEGTHTIDATLEGYAAKESIAFRVGADAASPSAVTVPLEPLGWIEFNITPPNSSITYQAMATTSSATPATATNGGKTRVKAGRYAVTITADGFQTVTEEGIEVESGKGRAFNKTLTAAAAATPTAPAAAAAIGKEAFDAPGPGVSYSLFKQTLPGTYSFQIKLRRSGLLGKRAKWVVNFIDNKNYIEYEIDDKNLKYSTHDSSRKERSKSLAHKLGDPAGDTYDLTVTLTANAVTVASAGQIIPLETPPGYENLLAGKFGFPKDENVGMDGFRFTPAK